MRMLAWSILIGILLPITVAAQDKPISSDYSPDDSQSSVIYLAQNTTRSSNSKKEDEDTSSQLPPPPASKTSITTEKPIKGTSGGILITEEPEEEPSGTDEKPQTSDERPAPGGAPGQPPGPPPPGGETPGRTRVASRSSSKKLSEIVKEELSIFNVPTDNLRTMKTLTDDDFNLRGMVYGEERGYLRILEADNDGKFKETWKSPPLNSPVREIFVHDIDRDGETDIVAYTNDGNIFIYGYKTHDLKYRTPENTYAGISCMVIANIDDDPQVELVYIANQQGELGNLIQFDPKSQFEEWRSTQTYEATDMIVGNVDKDPEVEIIMNTGEILSSKFKNVKWKSDVELGERLYLIDMDSDGVLELVSEYSQSYVKIIDVDERREKW